MEQLDRAILEKGRVRPGNILKVDSFLNHQMDIGLLQEIGQEFRRRFPAPGITKLLTIEASGIGIAAITAQYFPGSKVVFAKKSPSKNLDGALYTAQVESFTRGKPFQIQVASHFLTAQDTVLVLDDFLARGQAMLGLLEIVRQSGAKLAGCGVVIEKGFQEGGETLRRQGVNLCSLAIIDRLEEGKVHLRPQP